VNILFDMLTGSISFIAGLITVNFLSIHDSQSISSKNGWLLMILAPPLPAPSLLFGLRFRSHFKISIASGDKFLLIFSLPLLILWKSSSFDSEKYGVLPKSISYSITPSRYQSTLLPCP